MTYVFNPAKFKKEDDIDGISDEAISLLDSRYINLGENVYEQNINNLSVVNHNIASNGKIYFATDNTTQTTAFVPSFVTNKINQFASSNNTFTGQNIFRDFNIEDQSGNRMKIYQTGNDVSIENMRPNGHILFKNNGITSSIDNAGTLNVVQLSSPTIKCDLISLTNDYNIYRNFSGSLIFDNLRNGAEIVFQGRQFNGNPGWSFVFSSNSGLMYGMNNTISHTMESKAFKFRDNNLNETQSRVYLSTTNDLTIESKITSSNSRIKINTHNSQGVQKSITINENADMSDINNLSVIGKISIGNITHQFSNNTYIIDNNNNNASIAIRNRDSGGILREINIGPTMSMTGLNDLYAQRLFINNVLVNFASYDALITKTRNLYSNATDQTSIEHNSGRFLFLANATNQSSKNPIIQNNDNVLVGYNSSQVNNNVLTLCSWSDTSTGIRLTNTETQMYKAKVMDTLTFSDGTTQSSALSQSAINTMVVNAVSTMIPTGSVFPYAGQYVQNTPPQGYLWCDGSAVLQSQYPNLFSVVGHTYAYGRVLTNFFYLPDYRGAVLKGCYTNNNFAIQTSPMNSVGLVQNQNVGHHKHQFSDHRSSQNFDLVGFTAGVKHGLSTQLTSGNTFDATTNNLLDAENRVNSISVNYIIKI